MLTFNSLLVARHDNIGAIQVIRVAMPELEANQCRFKIEKFGFSANNITYMGLGKSFQYFDFFPSPVSPQAASSCPVWGMAVCVESRHPTIKVGERVYGYWPTAQYLIVTPVGVKPAFFHVMRPQLPDDRKVYNQYFRASGDSEYSREQEDAMILFRPLWGTSFFLDDFMTEKQFFGADTVLVSSASSKTAYCLALILHDKKKRVVGLTSSPNMAFVESLGWYDQVVDYADLETMGREDTLVYCDVAGNPKLNDRIHRHFGNQLKMQVTVGMSHFDG
ncbi:hypothetical protein HDU91_004143, partial [Kappamyces sp. JEL0680]